VVTRTDAQNDCARQTLMPHAPLSCDSVIEQHEAATSSDNPIY
jgi:hypothetical protein